MGVGAEYRKVHSSCGISHTVGINSESSMPA
eukprot:CAMPEP_0198253864 /NCGR_PEP_ID=MMETSP1447-20131203/4248_1 /TAXON_ID=420782 /ORGANISM="Chaetoceros dichaeta, Strain CCMP1751" /LENGTH=30 /DNA_ID= /DNA_START= /DNA_END= /DNA_ORIENTATION=